MALPALFVRIGADIDEFEKAMGSVSKRLNAVDREAQRAFSGFAKLGDRLSTVGTAITGAITLPLAGAAVAATKFASDFELEMRKVTSLLGGSTKEEFDALNKSVLQVSRSLGVDAKQSAQALYEVISAGIPKENAIEFLAVATKSAIAGTTETKVAVDALTTIIAAYGLETKDATEVSNAMFQAVNVGKFQFEDLAKAIGPAAQQAANLGISYEELLAATGTLSITSGGVSIAVTQIESAMRALIQPTKEMQGALERIGFQTGSAAVKTLGFEGTLQKLREETKGNAEAFNALFGRIEGATGALGLTGPQAVRAAKDLDTLRNASEGVGATQKALDEINKSAARQFEKLTAEMKATAIQFGTALLPSVNSLLLSLRPLVDLLISAVDTFTQLPQPVQTFAVAIGAAAAALGPLVLIAGQLLSALATVAPAITSLTGAIGLGGGAGLTGALAIAGPLAIAFGVAIAGWAIVTAITNIQRLNAELKRLEEALAEGKKATAQQASEIKILESAIAAHNKQIGNQRIEVSSAGKSVSEYIAALKAAVKENNLATFSVDAFGKATKKSATETAAMVVSTAALKEAAEKAEAAYKNAIRAYGEGKISLEQLGAAQERFIRAQDAADPERAAKRHEAAYFSMLDRYEDMATGIIAAAAQLKKVEGELAESVTKNAIDFGKAHERMRKDAETTVKIIVPLNKRLPEGIQDAIKQTRAVAAAYEDLAVKSPAELAKTVAAHKRSWELIKRDAGEGSVQALEAWINYEKSRQDAARRSGQVVTEEQRKALDAAQRQLDAALGKQESSWGKFTKQVSTIVNDLARDVSRATVNLFKNFFDADGFNKKLREETETLKAQLAERTKAIDEFRGDTEGKIEKVTTQYAEQLARETAQLRDSLADRQKEYEAFVSDAAETLDQLRNKEAERLFAEQSDLAAKLRDKEKVYQEYVEEVGEKEAEIRRTHADRLAEQLRDLRENLRDRQQAYSDFVEDTNRSLARIQSDLGETIEDAARSFNRRIQDENEDFARDSEKLSEDLRKAEKRGDKEQVAVLRKSLDQRTKDHQRSIDRLKEDLAEQIDDAKRRAAEQTEDLRTNLARRERDHKEYVEETIRKEREITESHAKEQERQLGDLQKSLDKRTRELLDFREETAIALSIASERSAARLRDEEADLQRSLDERKRKLDDYGIEVEEKIDQLTAHYNAKQAEEVAALNTELRNKLKEYDTYRSGVETKLEELEAAHKGPLDRIKDMFKTVFDSVQEAILRVASEAVIGVLIGKLKSLWQDILPGIGKAAAGAADAIGGIAGSAPIPQVGGGTGGIPSGGGAAGGAAGGLGGTIDLITGAISAAANVVSAIYNVRVEGSINQVERNTAAASIHLQNILERANEFWPSIRDMHRSLLDLILPTLREIRDGLKTLFTVNLTLNDAEQQRLFSSLLTRVGTFDTLATDRLLDIYARLGNVTTAVQDARNSVVKAISEATDILGGKLSAIENKLPSTLDKLLGGGGIGGFAGGVAGAAGAFAAGLIGALVNRGQGEAIDLIEENTRFTAIGTIGQNGIVATLREYLPKLQDILDFNWQVLVPWMQAIQSWTEMTPAMAVSGGAGSVVNVRVFVGTRELSDVLVEHDELNGGVIP